MRRGRFACGLPLVDVEILDLLAEPVAIAQQLGEFRIGRKL